MTLVKFASQRSELRLYNPVIIWQVETPGLKAVSSNACLD
jgi:hypothetical protein